MIRAIVIGRLEVIRGIEQKYPSIRQALVDYHQRFAWEVVSRIQQKLSGEILHPRTHRLHDSIGGGTRVEESNRGITIFSGTNVEYAAIHEYGFRGRVHVREYLRRCRRNTRTILKEVQDKSVRGMWIRKRGELTGNVAIVHAHARDMHMPERSFLRSTLKEMRNAYREGLQTAMWEAIRG